MSRAHVSELRLFMAPLTTPFRSVPESSSTRATPAFGTLQYGRGAPQSVNCSARFRRLNTGVWSCSVPPPPRMRSKCMAAAAGKAPQQNTLLQCIPALADLQSATPVVLRYRSCKLPSPYASPRQHMMRRLRPASASARSSTKRLPRRCRPQLLRQHTCRSALEASLAVDAFWRIGLPQWLARHARQHECHVDVIAKGSTFV